MAIPKTFTTSWTSGTSGSLSGGSAFTGGTRTSGESAMEGGQKYLALGSKKKKAKKKKTVYVDPYDLVAAKTTAGYHATFDSDIGRTKKVAK